ncbi:MAG: vanadium-dependent haloperoxidase, partial [Bryobacteraceae bacterium]
MFLANQKPTHPKWRFPAVFATMLCLVLPASRLAADEATRWNEVTAKASFDSGFANYPIPDSRLYAMVHAAVHDALNSIDHRYKLYLPGPTVTPDASPQAAVATAAHDVLVDQFNQLIGFGFPSQLSAIESAYAASLAAIPDTPAKMKGIALGKATAMAILKLRAGDVWNPAALVDPSYKQGTLPGEYRFTPGSDFAFAPKWGEVTPFALSDSERFQPGPPFPLAGKQYAQDFNEVKAIGGDGITTPSSRTPDQTQIALFWLEGSPLQWNRITRTVSAARRLSLWENARLFALMNFALADGYIATFDTKYHYKFWRPVTAI